MAALVFAALCLIWGFSWVGIKLSLEGVPPVLGAGFRFAVALLVLFFYARIRHVSLRLPEGTFRLVMLTGWLT